MAKILNWQKVAGKLTEKGLLVFTPRDLVRLFGVSEVAASFFIFRNTKKGLLVRLKKSPKGSLYSMADKMPSQYFIANKLYSPSYISFDTALSFHRLIPETIYGVTSATVRATREFTVNEVSFTYRKIKREGFTGYRLIEHLNDMVLMAEPEKALADYLYFVDLKKRGLHYERLNLSNIKKSKLIKYAKIFSRPGMLKLIEKIYADVRSSSRIR